MTASGTPVGRVLHAPYDIAGQATRSVHGLRLLGVEADAFAATHPFGYDRADIVPTGGRIGFARAALRASRTHDTFHFYFGLSFLPVGLRVLDGRALRATGRRVVVEFNGSDVRMPSIEAARNPYYVHLEGEDDATADRLMARWARVTEGHAICCDHGLDPFLERHFEHIHYVGQRVEVARYVPRPPDPDADRPLVIVHAPSNTQVKGTAFVRAAVARLSNVEYVEVTGRSYDEAMAVVAHADLVVDQLCGGGHGGFAVEAMSMAKPVVCYLLPEYAATLADGCPIIQGDPSTIADVLASWIERRAELREIGLASRAYAERNHDVGVVARRLIDAYMELPIR